MNVNGKNVLITGGAGGLGSEMARTLAAHGANIMILDLDSAKENAGHLVEELKGYGVEAYFEPLDVSVEEDWEKVVNSAVSKFGKIDVLVNNAGINIRKKIEEMSMDEWSTMMKINIGSVFLGTKYVLPVMRKQGGGSIINTSSVCGLIGHKYTTEAYTATKGAVTLLTKSIASRYGDQNIRCNSIHPSTVDTPLIHERLKDSEFAAERLGEVPLGKLAQAKDVANAVLYLASEEAEFINGIALPVDGGVTCY